MWKRVRPLLILLSVALNAAIVSVWTAHAVKTRICSATSAPCGPVWCGLHRQLGATETQWRQIEPRLLAFQKSAKSIGDEADQARAELIGLLAASAPDTAAIRAKQEQILSAQRRMLELVTSHLTSEKAALTPEQQRQLFELIGRRSGCGGGMGRMGPPSASSAGASEGNMCAR